ncbi:hypothetical protein D4Q76_00600, partial [archaeon]
DLDKVKVPNNWTIVIESENGKKYRPNVPQMQKDIKRELIEGIKESDRIQELIYNSPILKPYAVYPENYPI